MISMQDVVVQRMVRSSHARAAYKLSPQRKPVASVNLLGVRSMGTLRRIWKEDVGLRGRFALSARDKKGRFKKTLGTLIVSGRNYDVRLDDLRCPLYHYMRKQREQRRREREMDYTLGGKA